jgi:hypothetical protein
MKQIQYIEGQQAAKNFEEGMKALFKVPKEKVVKDEKVRRNPSQSSRKPRHSDKG